MFNQFSFGCKQWVGPAGERAFLPKSAGMGLMASAFQSRELGFGMQLTAEQLKDVNRKRAEDIHYFDKVAAQDVNESTKKPVLTASPFLRLLEYGANNDGYWTGNHMILQFEDCIDCLRVLYAEQYDFVFLFDHSSGHAKKQENGEDASAMTQFHSGRLQKPTLIEEAR